MTSLVRALVLALTGLWTGALFTIGFVIAPYLFALAAQKSQAVPNTGVAADLIGPVLWGADAASLVVVVVLLLGLFTLRWAGQLALGGRYFVPEMMLFLSALCAKINLIWLNPGVRALKGQLAELYGAFHLADRTHPLYLEFNWLHQTSTALFVVGFLAALACLLCLSHFQERSCVPSTT